MIETKTFEVLDRMTFIPCIGIRLSKRGVPEADAYLLGRSGYGTDPCVLFGRLIGGAFSHDPYEHSSTLRDAHAYVEAHWDELPSGAVIDCEFVRQEVPFPKNSERVTFP